jgi:predicted DNA-binding transcriptional regulator AlpA
MTELLPIADLARMLRLTPASIYAMRHRGDGPRGIRVGKHVRFDPGDVEKWLASRKEEIR